MTDLNLHHFLSSGRFNTIPEIELKIIALATQGLYCTVLEKKLCGRYTYQRGRKRKRN